MILGLVYGLVILTSASTAFQFGNIPKPLSLQTRSFGVPRQNAKLHMAKKKKKKGGKGFGEANASTTVSKKDQADFSTRSEPLDETPDFSSPVTTETTTTDPESSESLNAGQRALLKMREQRDQKKDEELRKVKELRSVDEFVRDDPSAAVIPEKVAMRMGTRMLPFVGIPLFGGMAAFVGFWYFATYKNYEFQPSLVAFTTIGILAVGLVGITYSVMSASWDPDVDGSALGTEEFGSNLDSLKDGLKRSRENALLRERMAGMPEEEIEQAIRELDKRDERAKRKEMSFQEKMRKEME